MLDIGWPELLVLLIIALVVIGPKDLPKAMYTLGKWVRAIRRMTNQMQKQFDDAMREAELDDIKDKLKTANKYNLRKQVENTIDPKGQIKKSLDVGEGKSVRQYLADGAKPGRGQDAEAAADEAATDQANGAAADKLAAGERIRQQKLAALDRKVGDEAPKVENREVGDENADKVGIAGVQEKAPREPAGKGTQAPEANGEPRKASPGTGPGAGQGTGKTASANGSAKRAAKPAEPAEPAAKSVPEKETVPSSSGGGA
ncbi:MAG: Sec-independent protein translocase protein TatB [Azospirillaceae bacterium]